MTIEDLRTKLNINFKIVESIENEVTYKLGNTQFGVVDTGDDFILVQTVNKSFDRTPVDFNGSRKTVSLSNNLNNDVDVFNTLIESADSYDISVNDMRNLLKLLEIVVCIEERVYKLSSVKYNIKLIKADYCYFFELNNNGNTVWYFGTESWEDGIGTDSYLGMCCQFGSNSDISKYICTLDGNTHAEINGFIDKCTYLINRGEEYCLDYLKLEEPNEDDSSVQKLGMFVDALEKLVDSRYKFYKKNGFVEMIVNNKMFGLYYIPYEVDIMVINFTNNVCFKMNSIFDTPDFEYFAQFIKDYISANVLKESTSEKLKYTNVWRVWDIANRVVRQIEGNSKVTILSDIDNYVDAVMYIKREDGSSTGNGFSIWGTLFSGEKDDVLLSLTNRNDENMNISFSIKDFGDEETFIKHCRGEIEAMLNSNSSRKDLESKLISSDLESKLLSVDSVVRRIYNKIREITHDVNLIKLQDGYDVARLDIHDNRFNVSVDFTSDKSGAIIVEFDNTKSIVWNHSIDNIYDADIDVCAGRIVNIVTETMSDKERLESARDRLKPMLKSIMTSIFGNGVIIDDIILSMFYTVTASADSYTFALKVSLSDNSIVLIRDKSENIIAKYSLDDIDSIEGSIHRKISSIVNEDSIKKTCDTADEEALKFLAPRLASIFSQITNKEVINIGDIEYDIYSKYICIKYDNILFIVRVRYDSGFTISLTDFTGRFENKILVNTSRNADVKTVMNMFDEEIRKLYGVNDKVDNSFRLVSLKYNNKIVGYRFKSEEVSYDISIEKAKELGVSAFKVTRAIDLEDYNGLLMSKSEIKTGKCCMDISDNDELVMKLFNSIMGK